MANNGSPGLQNGIEIIDSEKNHNYSRLLETLVSACDAYEDQVGFTSPDSVSDHAYILLVKAIREARKALT